jgi:hypothetical protein
VTSAGYTAPMEDAPFAARFGLAALATWRVTHLLAEEDGPADAVVRRRASAGDGWVGELMDCFYCLRRIVFTSHDVGDDPRFSDSAEIERGGK